MNNELTIKEESGIMLADDMVIALAQKAEARIEAVKKIMQLAIKITNEKDWTLISGNPYMEASGGEKIAALFSMSWTINEPEYEEYDDGHFMYSYKGTFIVAGKSIEAVGSRSSRDGFFKAYEYVPIQGTDQKEKKLIPPNRIDKGNVKKSAFTNLINNGIKRSLGLRNVTIEDLKAAGLDTDKIDGYSHNQAEMSGDVSELAGKIKQMLVEMYPDAQAQAAQLARITLFKNRQGKTISGVKSIDKLSDGRLKVAYGKVQKEYDAWKKTSGKKAPAQSTASSQSTELLGTSSGEYQNVKDAMTKATTGERIDEILGSLAGTFNEGAIKGLSAFAATCKKALTPF